jgi:hypothetical protein
MISKVVSAAAVAALMFAAVQQLISNRTPPTPVSSRDGV